MAAEKPRRQNSLQKNWQKATTPFTPQSQAEEKLVLSSENIVSITNDGFQTQSKLYFSQQTGSSM
jgi:hypothetical protein